jgi:hypothetical protein
MSKKHKRRIEDMVSNIDPEKDMPLPERLRKEEVVIKPSDVGKMEDLIPSLIKQEELAEAPVQPLSIDSGASEAKDVSTESEVVETDSEEIIKARKDAHQAMLRR